MTGVPADAQPAAIATGLVPIPTPSPKPLPERINPAVLQYHGTTKPAPSASGPPDDHASALVGGIWYCRTFAGSVMTHAFSKTDSGSSIAVETHVPVAADRVATLHESYTRGDGTRPWRVLLADGLIEATAPAWNGDTWTFEGRQRDGTKSFDFRMIFSRFGSDVFVRDFQHRDGGTWQTFSGETCRRDVAP